jgi:hypothetical protein
MIMRMSRAARAAAVLAAPVLLAGGLGPGPAQAATAACQSWTGGQPASPGTNTQLSGVTVLSACNAWAVGTFVVSSGGVNENQTLTEHWDGSNWKVVPSPNPGVTNSLASVRAVAASNIWAVGTYATADAVSHTLIEHWDGHHWTQQASPSPGTSVNQLTGVRPVSGTEAWAVGYTEDTNSATPLALHFTGGKWQQAKLPGSLGGFLFGVAASSAKDVWAVGEGGVRGSAARRALRAAARPGADVRHLALTAAASGSGLLLHWNGKTWTQVPSPDDGAGDGLLGVGVSSPTSALAVGTQVTTSHDVFNLAMRWNGKTWTDVPSPSPGGAAAVDFLDGVYMTSPTSAWVVGGGDSDSSRPVIERWNGSQLTTVPAPDPGSQSELLGVSGSSATSIWAVGNVLGPVSNQALALRCC